MFSEAYMHSVNINFQILLLILHHIEVWTPTEPVQHIDLLWLKPFPFSSGCMFWWAKGELSSKSKDVFFFFLDWLVLSRFHLLIHYDQLPDPCWRKLPHSMSAWFHILCTVLYSLSFLVFYLYQTIGLISIWSKHFLLLVYCVPRPL